MTTKRGKQELSPVEIVVLLGSRVAGFIGTEENVVYTLETDTTPIWEDEKSSRSLGSRMVVTLERRYVDVEQANIPRLQTDGGETGSPTSSDVSLTAPPSVRR